MLFLNLTIFSVRTCMIQLLFYRKGRNGSVVARCTMKYLDFSLVNQTTPFCSTGYIASSPCAGNAIHQKGYLKLSNRL